ncbi:MAG TPA: tetratricopeptide repeat protein [Isosphaeraceae bacterium]|nr:tetratricopeptide repeat protein [Isosphaeraceae bacterium]
MATSILIQERSGLADGRNAVVSFDGQGEYPVTVANPFSEKQEEELEWYFEDHLRFPFLEGVRARAAAAGVQAYGEALFAQVFRQDPAVLARYAVARDQGGPADLRFAIAGSPAFHQLHWEALKDPELPRAFALEAPMVRKNLNPPVLPADVRSSPTINLLIVVARPRGRGDVGYRTISRPLVEALQQARLRVRVEILRPGTYKALVKHLEGVRDRLGPGFYHIIHFDLHGALLAYDEFERGCQANAFFYQARYARPDLARYDGEKAFLAFAADAPGQSDLAEAGEVADLLTSHRVPVAVLNACQSGKQVGARETSLGSRLMQAGVQLVVAMGYSVTVTAAELMMTTLYDQLFAGSDLATAIRRARLELFNQKSRRAYFDQTIDLEDWVLPVVYQNQELKLAPREPTPEEWAELYGPKKKRRYPFPKPAYGFHGRDVDILEIESRLLSRNNLLLVQGMGGAGKTTLLHHLAAWWQTTGFVDWVFYFGYDQKAWNRQQILRAIAKQFFPTKIEFASRFEPLRLDGQQELIAEKLRAARHLLILDNLESITGSALAIPNTLSPNEQRALHGFLEDLAGGQTLVLLGSRGGEDWLAPGTFGDNLYTLPGLDPEAASALADRILETLGVTKYRGSTEFRRLLDLLAGYPLALEVILRNLATQTPAQVLDALQAGDIQLDCPDAKDKTESILRCIEYSFSNLSPGAQDLLACLVPFTGVVLENLLEVYTEHLKRQPPLAHLPFDRWPDVLKEARAWGLLGRDADTPSGYLRVQPVFPFFLRNRLNAPDRVAARHAVEEAFRQHYNGVSRLIVDLLGSKNPQEKQLGQVLARLEYENMAACLRLDLDARESVIQPYRALSAYIDVMQDHRRGLELGEAVLGRLAEYPEDKLAGPLGAEFVGVLHDIAGRQLSLKQYADAEKSYRKALALWLANTDFDAGEVKSRSASIYHQLGWVAQEQRQWAQAEEHYRKALEIKIECGDRYEQASSYHQLGRVAQEQRQWAQAEELYRKALEIDVEFGDRYAQAPTYHNLGMVAQERRQWAQAEEHYRKALEISVEFDARYEQAKIYHQLGRVAQEQRQWAQAEEHYRTALEIWVKYGDKHGEAITRSQLETLREAAGPGSIPGPGGTDSLPPA